MRFCHNCGVPLPETSNFCSTCGTTLVAAAPAGAAQATYTQQQVYPPPAYAPPPGGLHHTAARGFAQIFGLHPAIAFLTIVIDFMLFGGEVITVGASLPISIGASVVLAVIAYKAQRTWYGDDKESALIKALILALLTAIPTPLPAFLYIPAGILGFFRRKSN